MGYTFHGHVFLMVLHPYVTGKGIDGLQSARS